MKDQHFGSGSTPAAVYFYSLNRLPLSRWEQAFSSSRSFR